MRLAGMRSVMAGILGLVAVSGLAGCASTSARGYDDELPSHRMTGMEPSGAVTRVDDTQQVIVLENGQMYRVSGDNAVYVDGRPVAFRSVRPGSRVTIVNGTPVVYQNGQYVVVQPGQGAVAPGGVLTPQPSGTVVAAPPATVVTAPQTAVVVPGTLRMTGRITDVDRREIRVKMDNGESFEFKRPEGMVFRKGDPVTIDMTFGGSPSALPR